MASGRRALAGCRLEQLANFLSPVRRPLIVVKSTTFVETFTACGTIFSSCYRTSVGEGAFTVDDDRVCLGPVIRGTRPTDGALTTHHSLTAHGPLMAHAAQVILSMIEHPLS